MSPDRLEVVLGGRAMGNVESLGGGRLRFTYEESWRRDPGALPLSLSMPMTLAEHGHAVIEPFLQGLLPDNDEILRSWARRHHVSSRNAFALLAYVGEDCAGAIQLVRAERLDMLTATDTWDVEWVDEAEIGARLRTLRRDSSAWQVRPESGQFSLAGAQPKTALLLEGDRWGVPSGRAPTTHILKPPMRELDGHVENEHLCLQLARELGMPVARSKVQRFGDQVAIVVERFDRARTAELAAGAAARAATLAAASASDVDPARAAKGAAEASAQAAALSALAETTPILRLHQEDACQALGVSPTSKYQNEGGPSAADVVDLLRRHSSRPVEDVWTLVEALAFNWLIAGTDAHAKNYSILHGGAGRVRLAPLYDLASALPYEDMEPQRLTLAMKIGGKYRLRDIGGRQWEKLAGELSLDAEELLSRVGSATERLPDAMATVRANAVHAGLTHPIVERLSLAVQRRAPDCLRSLGRQRPTGCG